MRCEYCEIVERESKAPILYIDEELVVAVKDKVLAPGQITVFPRAHYTILEMVPELILAKCSVVANKVSMALFESLGCHGTNIVIANGISAGQSVPHFGIEVVPRIPDDTVGLRWEGKQFSDDEFEIVGRALVEDISRAAADRVRAGEKKKGESELVGTVTVSGASESEMVKSGEGSKGKSKDQKVSPLVRSVRRIP